MKALISSSVVRIAGLTLLAAVFSFSPGEALMPAPDCREFAGCMLCENDDCEFIICDEHDEKECD